jgi:tRNA pseudouridine55 synthase
MNPSGVLIVDKPIGITSHDVILKLRRMLGTRRIGHAGTLDPNASGLLLACVGRATKIVQFLTEYDKGYQAVIKLGVTTETYDGEGKVTGINHDIRPTPDQIRETLLSFRGKIQQTPPAYSALKHKGRKLYQYARAGEEVKIESREVDVKEIELLDIEPPYVKFKVRCSKGTYVRSLASDIGLKLGCGAHLYELQRTEVGPFKLDQSFSLEELEAVQQKGEVEGIMVSVEQALSHLPSVVVKLEFSERVKHGADIDPTSVALIEADFKPDQTIVIKDPKRKVLAVGRAFASSKEFKDESRTGKLFEYTRVI